MTAVDDRPRTAGIVKVFENLDVPEGFKAELLRGVIVMTAGPDVAHNDIVDAVQDQIPRQRWRRLRTQDIAILEETSQPQPDLVVLERGAGPGHGRLMPSEVITLLVEVVSKTSVDRDYMVKRSIYAAAKIPAYYQVRRPHANGTPGPRPRHQRIRRVRERQAPPLPVTKSISSSTRPSSSGSRSR
ncbi:Uma2 family endonuclease [Streptomyces sp. Amel2xC10]|uniref:Uma2 family endonuclease n=1 Tax=Streptomyces sp. Amel2xC10 TaxID=1305826 RepID=UPI000A084DC5|nr:Uncharacterized protein conserved in cyanobacteria [Streptomyces sp. Amel2xC10]